MDCTAETAAGSSGVAARQRKVAAVRGATKPADTGHE